MNNTSPPLNVGADRADASRAESELANARELANAPKRSPRLCAVQTDYPRPGCLQSLRKRKRNRHIRAGAVIVEMAVCIPVMLLLVFGCLELNSSIFLSQTLTSAAHEGALIGLRQNATESEVANRVALVMKARNISQYALDIDTFGTPFDALESGQKFAIHIEAPRSNSFIRLSKVDAKVTAMRP